MSTSSRIILLMVAPVAVVNRGTRRPVMTGNVPSALAWAVRVPVKVEIEVKLEGTVMSEVIM